MPMFQTYGNEETFLKILKKVADSIEAIAYSVQRVVNDELGEPTTETEKDVRPGQYLPDRCSRRRMRQAGV